MTCLENSVGLSVKGKFRVEILDGETRKIKKSTGWQKNLVLDGFFNILNSESESMFNYIHVGTGTSAPDVTQTSLDAWVASDAVSSLLTPAPSGPDYEWKKEIYCEFAKGSVVGNMSEVGTGPGSGNGGMVTRSLFKDEAGNPTTVTVTSGEILRIYYTITIGTAGLNGIRTQTDTIGGVTTTINRLFVARHMVGFERYYVHRFSYRSFVLGVGETLADNELQLKSTADTVNNYRNVLGTLESASDNTDPGFRVSVVNEQHRIVSFFGAGDANFSNGIQFFGIIEDERPSWFPRLIYEFDPPIPKTSLDELTFVILFNWVRAV